MTETLRLDKPRRVLRLSPSRPFVVLMRLRAGLYGNNEQ
jgi:hypothetical protein